MSAVTLEQVKEDLRLTHDSDDALLQILIDAAEDEAMQFLGVSELPTVIGSSEPPVKGSIYAAIFLSVKAKYEATSPDEIEKLRVCFETLLMPYRENLGV